MKSAKIIVTLVIAAVLSSGAAGVTYDFEDQTLGATFDVNDTMISGGRQFDFEPYQWPGGIWFSGGHVSVQNSGMAGGSGLDLWFNNLNISTTFDSPVSYVEFAFGEYGGNANISVNGDFHEFDDFSELDGINLGGCSLYLTSGSGAQNQTGILRIDGSVSQFAVGGQEFAIDNLQIPEPATLLILGLGVIFTAKRRKYI